MLYEVFIPSVEKEGYDVTITVEANNWMTALKSGLERTGEPNADIRGVMCDIKDDNSIHVTDAATRRVFILRELEPEDEELPPMAPSAQNFGGPQLGAAATTLIAPGPSQASVHAALDMHSEPEEVIELTAPARSPQPPAAQPKAPAPAPAPTPAPAPRTPEAAPPASPHPDLAPQPAPSRPQAAYVSAERPVPAQPIVSDDGFVRIGSSDYKSLREQSQTDIRVIREERRRSGAVDAVPYTRPESNTVSENILEDIFLEIQTIHETPMPMEEVVNFVMDMAMSKVPAESGAILFADVNGLELYFATARGPKANDVMEFRVPMGQGLAGFCAHEGVSLAISDASRDPRFYSKISDTLSYPTHSIVCAPIQYEGRVYGCLELINRRGGSTFSSNEVNALTYIGNQFAMFINALIMEREKL